MSVQCTEAVFCSSLMSCSPGMLFRYFLNGFDMLPVAASITGTMFLFISHFIIIIIIIIIIISFSLPFEALPYRFAVHTHCITTTPYSQVQTPEHRDPSALHNLVARLQKGAHEAADTDREACCNHRTFNKRVMSPQTDTFLGTTLSASCSTNMAQQRRKKNAITSRLKMSHSCDLRLLLRRWAGHTPHSVTWAIYTPHSVIWAVYTSHSVTWAVYTSHSVTWAIYKPHSVTWAVYTPHSVTWAVYTSQCHLGHLYTTVSLGPFIHHSVTWAIYTPQCYLGRLYITQCLLGNLYTTQCHLGNLYTTQCHLGRLYTTQCHLGLLYTTQCHLGRLYITQCHLGRLYTT